MSVCAIQRIYSRRIEEIETDTELAFSPLPMPTASTITAARAPDQPMASAFRPQLSPPRPYYMWTLVQIGQKMEAIVQKEGINCERDTQASLNRLLAFDRERIEVLQKTAQELSTKESWSVWQTVAQYVATASSIMLGLTVFGASPVAGALLVAAGGLGLLNRAISDSGGWKWLVSYFNASYDLQLKISEGIDSTLTYLSMAMAMAGALGAWHAGAWALSAANRDAAMNRTLQVILFYSAFVQQSVRIGISRSEQKSDHLKSDLQVISTHAALARQQIKLDTQQFRNLIELSEEINERLHSLISSIPQ